jgi:AbrB family looped-hinge helix DNA binding protein
MQGSFTRPVPQSISMTRRGLGVWCVADNGSVFNAFDIDRLSVQLREMTVKVSPKFQVVIPEPVRTQLGLRAGDRVEVIAKGGIAYLVPLRTLEQNQATFAGTIDRNKLREKSDRIS